MHLGRGRDAEVALPAGEPLEVVVTSAAATGHVWSLDVAAGTCSVAEHTVRAGRGFGSAGEERFVLATGEDEVELVLRLQAPWRDEPVRQHRLVVHPEAP